MRSASWIFVFLLSGELAAQQGRLPLEPFTTAQGLASDSITTILTDSRGFLWFGTLDGLSRYDGHNFVNYTTDDGLPDRMVWKIAEDRRGGIWIGTNSGLVAMTPEASRGRLLFRPVPLASGKSTQSLAIGVAEDGTVWAACDTSLCFVRNGHLEIDTSFRDAGGDDVRAIAAAPDGALWIGSGAGLYRRSRDGRWKRWEVLRETPTTADTINDLTIDPEGRLWIATGFGLVVFTPATNADNTRSLRDRAGVPLVPGMRLPSLEPGQAVWIVPPSDTPHVRCMRTLRARNGAIWQPTYYGVLQIENGWISFFDNRDGLPRRDITSIAEDPAGNLWIGSRSNGVHRLVTGGATTYTRAYGLANERIMSAFALADGTVCSTNREGLSCFRDGEGHHGSLWPRGKAHSGWGWNQIVVIDRDGTWWFATGEGLVHWPRVDRIEDLGRIAPLATYTQRDGLGSIDIFRVWQDSRGMLWVSTFADQPLSRGDPRTGRFTSFGTEAGFPRSAPTAFAEDRAGNVWIGTYTGDLLRVRGDRFERIDTGLQPPAFVRDLHVDSKGRLWIGTTLQIARIDEPAAERVVVRRFTRGTGLTADGAYTFAEMPDGRMAIGSQRGLDLFDLESGTVVNISTRDGLPSNEISAMTLDRNGALWLGTMNGLSRLTHVPRNRAAAPPPRPRIHAIAIDGTPLEMAELGATSAANVRIEYPQHAMAIGFSAPDYDTRSPLRFEYRLARNARWTSTGAQRFVMFDRLPAGASTLEVRAVSAGVASEPARLSFVVVPALWKRTWFVVAVIAMAIALAAFVHRYRVSHLIALERVRTRVATDLHDDLGSSLSRISILSEAAKRSAGDPAPILDEIAESARGLVGALGDSIWSIDPRRDDVRSLLLRVRNFGAALFESDNVALDVRSAPGIESIHLGPEQRRETYLILKEALNNAARHARARNVAVIATADARQLTIAVSDDGRGFVVAPGDGHGLASMTDRAKRLGGTLEIASAPGAGVRLTVTVPI